MKKIFNLFLILIVCNLISCDQNDDVSTPINKFTSAGLDFDTPNCYIEFDEFTDNEASFNLFFLNGRMFDNDNNENGSTGDYLYSIGTSNFVFYNITALDNPSIEIPQYPNIQTGVAYVGSTSDTVIVHDFVVDEIEYTTNGYDFGMPDDTTGIVHQPMPGNNSITINSYSFDATTQTGNINYHFLDAGGNAITGHYEGTLGVIQD